METIYNSGRCTIDRDGERLTFAVKDGDFAKSIDAPEWNAGMADEVHLGLYVAARAADKFDLLKHRIDEMMAFARGYIA